MGIKVFKRRAGLGYRKMVLTHVIACMLQTFLWMLFL